MTVSISREHSRRVCRRLERMQRLEGRASAAVALSFAEVFGEHHYRALGFTSMLAYATERLEMSASRFHQLRGVAGHLREFPALREAMASGRVTWTKARAIAPILTAESATTWIDLAATLPRRELERRIADARGAARASSARRAAGAAQEAIPVPRTRPGDETDPASGAGRRATPGDTTPGDATPGDATERVTTPRAAAADTSHGGAPAGPVASTGSGASPQNIDVRVELRLRLDPIAHAHAEAAWEHARKQGFRGSKSDFVVAAMSAFATTLTSSRRAPSDTATAPSSESPGSIGSSRSARSVASARRASSSLPGARSQYQIVVTDCPSCRRARVGDRPVSDAARRALLADADIIDSRGHRRATIPTGLRRRVLMRDDHRCTIPGCTTRHHLAVHHRIPVELGGRNTLENLTTLCWSCHWALHAMPLEVARTVLCRPPRHET